MLGGPNESLKRKFVQENSNLSLIHRAALVPVSTAVPRDGESGKATPHSVRILQGRDSLAASLSDARKRRMQGSGPSDQSKSAGRIHTQTRPLRRASKPRSNRTEFGQPFEDLGALRRLRLDSTSWLWAKLVEAIRLQTRSLGPTWIRPSLRRHVPSPGA